MLTTVRGYRTGLAMLLALAGTALTAVAARGGPTTQRTVVSVSVDPRVELFSIIFHLAGHPEYNQPRVRSYAADVKAHFASFSQHEVVQLARTLRHERGVSFDAPMSLCVQVNDAKTMKLLAPLDPWPEGIDQRWRAEDIERFLAAARRFADEARFQQFLDDHQDLYRGSADRMRQTLSAHARVSWFDDFFGVRPRANFQLVLGMLNGGSCYGTRAVVGGSEELYCMLGVWQCDSQGLPEFPQSVMPTVIHEFAHSYANPLIDAHLEKLEPAGNELFARHQKSMERRAYKGGPTVLRESLVRACVVRYFHSVDGADAAKAEADEQVRRGFPWTSELSNVLADYEANRATYPTLDAFMPQIARFFDTYVQTTRR